MTVLWLIGILVVFGTVTYFNEQSRDKQRRRLPIMLAAANGDIRMVNKAINLTYIRLRRPPRLEEMLETIHELKTKKYQTHYRNPRSCRGG